MLRLFGAVLLCGALQCVSGAFHSTAQLNADTAQFRLSQQDYSATATTNVRVRLTKLDHRLHADADCDTVIDDQPFYILKLPANGVDYAIDTSVLINTDPTVVSYGTIGGTNQQNVAQPFDTEGKYKACGCFLGSTFCDEVAPDASSAAAWTAQNYSYDLGWLHVVDSVAPVGTQGISSLSNFKPVAPLVVLPASYLGEAGAPDTIVEAKASWAFGSIVPVVSYLDQIRIIDTTDHIDGMAQLGAWQCGQSYWNGNTTADAIVVRGGSALTSTQADACSNGNNASLIGLNNFQYNGLLDVDAATCVDYWRRETEPFAAPAVNTTGYALGYACYCSYSIEGECVDDHHFGTALGPIIYRQFAVADQTKHFTLRADANQQVTLSSREAKPFSNKDKIGLVRLDKPSSVERGSWDYPSNSHGRTCGWANLDYLPSSTVATTSFAQSQNGTNTFDPVVESTEALFVFDMRNTHGAYFQMCMCQSSFIDLSLSDNRLSYVDTFNNDQSCMDPSQAVASFDPQVNNNFQGNFWNLYYSQAAGYLHVVNTFSAVDIILQTQASSHLTVKFNSRPNNGVRVADYEFYIERYNDFIASRFYITDGECGTGAPVNSIENPAPRTQTHARLIDTGGYNANSEEQQGNTYVAKDTAFFATGGSWDQDPSDLTWGSLWTLTTGWSDDVFKPYGGSGSTDGAGSSLNLDLVTQQGSGISALSTAEGLDLKLCMCDQTTMFQPNASGVGLSCMVSAQEGDYSKFQAEVGSVSVRKFYFNDPTSTKSKHYSIPKSNTGTSFTVPVSTNPLSNDPTGISLNDKIGILPAYGDGYGLDDADPAFTSSNNGVFSDPSSSSEVLANKPWKSEYMCGRDALGTQHNFYRNGNWHTVGGSSNPATIPIIGLSSADTSQVVTEDFDAATITSYKYKLCYCSYALGGNVACPSNSLAADFGGSTKGIANAYRYNDFMGYLYVVDIVSLPLYTAYPSVPTPVGTEVIFTTQMAEYTTNDKVLYTEFSADVPFSSCGRDAAYGATTGILDTNAGSSITGDGSGNMNITPPVFTQATTSSKFSLCYCSAFLETLDERVTDTYVFEPESTACDNHLEFGATLGSLLLKPFVTSRVYDQHFTVTSQAESQTIDIYDYDANANIAVADDAGFDTTNADQLAFLPLEVGSFLECGVDTPLEYHVVPMQSRDTDKLISQGYNFLFNSIVANSLTRVCYCQVSLDDDGTPCAYDAETRFYSIGYLHVVDMAVWPQNFIMATNRVTVIDDQDYSPFTGIRVKFNPGFINNADNKFIISGVDVNSDTTRADQTFRCGSVETVAQYGFSVDQFKTSRNQGTTENSDPSATVVVLDQADWKDLTAGIASDPSTGSVGETLGVNSFKLLCMCNADEADTDASQQQPCMPGAFATITDFSKFGNTIGKVYLAKTLTLAAQKSSGNLVRAAGLARHYTTFLAAAEVELALGADASYTATPVPESDVVGVFPYTEGFVSGTCGYSTIANVLPIVETVTGAAIQVTGSELIRANYAPQAQKFTMCACRYAIAEQCNDAFTFFEEAGYLHVVDQISGVGSLFVEYDGLAIGEYETGAEPKTVTITFDFENPGYNLKQDRFAVVPFSTSTPQFCGNYKVNLENFGQILANSSFGERDWNNLHVPSSNKYEMSAKYTSGEVRFYDTNFESPSTSLLYAFDHVSAFHPTVGSSSQTSTTTPDMAFRDFRFNYTYKLCYCAYNAEGSVCKSQRRYDQEQSAETAYPTDTERYFVEYYQNYGVELAQIRPVSFLTSEDTSAWTIYRNEPNPTFYLGYDLNARQNLTEQDSFVIIPATGTCGDESTNMLFDGQFQSTDLEYSMRYDGYPLYFNATTNEIVAVKLSNETVTNLANNPLSPGKYKVCLCLVDNVADSSVQCSTASSQASPVQYFIDQAGYLYILGGPDTLAQQSLMVEAFDSTATVSISFGPGLTLSTEDRFVLVGVDAKCGDTSASLVDGSSLSSDAQYTVATSNVLTAGPLEFTQPGQYRICFCSFELEGSCPNATDALQMTSYGATVGMLVVSDMTINDRQIVSTLAASTSITLEYSSDIMDCNSLQYDSSHAQYYFMKTTSACADFYNSSGLPAAGGVSVPGVPCSGVETTFDFSSFLPGKDFLRLCVARTPLSTGGIYAYTDFPEVGVFVTDVTVEPRVTPAGLADITLTYANSVAPYTDRFWFLLSTEDCSTGAPATASSISTAAMATAPSGTVVENVDFSMATPGNDYRLCVGQGCVNGVCSYYFDLRQTSTIVSVYTELDLEPHAIGNGTNTTISFSYEGIFVDAGWQVWFQQTQPCQLPAGGAASTNTDARYIGTAPLLFQTDLLTPSQDIYLLCGQAPNGEPLSLSPVGIYAVDISVTPQTVNLASVQQITIDKGTTLNTGDVVSFVLSTESCPTTAPAQASTTSTNAITVTTSSAYDFDFSQVEGQTRMCLFTSDKVIDLKGDVDTEILVVDLVIGTSSVRPEAGVAVTVAYGQDVLVQLHGKIWFQKNDCTGTLGSSSDRSSVEQVPASGDAAIFSFAGVAEDRTLLALCYLDNGTTTRFESIGVYVTDIQVYPSSLFQTNDQSVVLSEASGNAMMVLNPLQNTMLQFRHSSVSCAVEDYQLRFASSTGLAENDTLSAAYSQADSETWCYGANATVPCDVRCSSVDNCIRTDYDLESAFMDGGFYRLCLYEIVDDYTSAIDLDVVRLYLVDLSVSPTAVMTGGTHTLTFANTDGSNIPDLHSLSEGDTVWFGEAECGTDAPTEADTTRKTTDAAVMVASAYDYDFDFTAVSGFVTMCVLRAGTVRPYSGLSVYVTDAAVDFIYHASAQNLTDVLNVATIDYGPDPSKPIVLSVQTAIIPEGEFAVGLVDDTAVCTTTTSSLQALNSTGAPFSSTIQVQWNQTTVGVFKTCLRLTFEDAGGQNPDVVFELPNKLHAIDLGLITTSVYQLADQAVTLSVGAGTGIGDRIFFADGMQVDTCPETVPTTGSVIATAAAEITYIHNGQTTLTLDFSTLHLDNDAPPTYYGEDDEDEKMLLCLVRNGQTAVKTVSTYWYGATDPSSANTLVNVSATEELFQDVFNFPHQLRVIPTYTRPLQIKLVDNDESLYLNWNNSNALGNYDSGYWLSGNVDWFFFVPDDHACPLYLYGPDGLNTTGQNYNQTAAQFIASTGSVGSVSEPSGPTPADNYLLNFVGYPRSNRLLRACLYEHSDSDIAPNYLDLLWKYAEFSNIGIVVSDIKIISTLPRKFAVATVVNQVDQTISFSQSAENAFEEGTALYFRKYDRAPGVEQVNAMYFPCDPVPTESGTEVSAPAVVPVVDSSQGVQAFSLDFDFSLTSPTADVYRLCVVKPSGQVLDFSPLGVRVTDLTIFSVINGKKLDATVKPLPAQQLQFEYTTAGNNILDGSKVWFIDSSDSTLNCQCSSPDVDASGYISCRDQGGVSSNNTLASRETLSFDFSSFVGLLATGKPALCVQNGSAVPDISEEIYLSGITVSFDLGVSPMSVPSNTGQQVKLSYTGGNLATGDEVLFVHPSKSCTGINFTTAHDESELYSSMQTVTTSDAILEFDFDGMYQSAAISAVLCVHDMSTGTMYKLPGVTIEVTKPVVSLAGDPHVRTPSGAWLDFYGESDVYQLLDGDIQANAKFGYAVRDNLMIWHPQVMRPGTLVEEVGIKLKGTQTSLRLGIQGGGLVSLRDGRNAPEFWASSEPRTLRVGDFTVTWAQCVEKCEVVMPWGTHHRDQSLTVRGHGELLQLWVTSSGGYRFVDVEAMPADGSTGLLADASAAPAALADRLLHGGESVYKASVAMLS